MNTTLHIPINKTVKDQAETVVKKQGYSSLQEVIRVLIFALANGDVKSTFIPTDMTQILTPSQDNMLMQREKETREAIKQGRGHSVNSVKEMMEILENTSHKHK